MFHVLKPFWGLNKPLSLAGLLVGWLVGWLAGWLVGWLAGWLIAWSAGCHVLVVIYSRSLFIPIRYYFWSLFIPGHFFFWEVTVMSKRVAKQIYPSNRVRRRNARLMCRAITYYKTHCGSSGSQTTLAITRIARTNGINLQLSNKHVHAICSGQHQWSIFS